MNYVSIINIIFFAISIAMSVYLFNFVFFAVSSLVHRKKFPSSEEKCRFGLIISAKDEENVIPRLINSIRSTDYPQDKLDIFIIAHNCKDNTASVAKELGANVIVFNDLKANTLGYAYQYAFKQINIHDYDGFLILNADNIVSKNYFTKMNDAFVHFDKKCAITSFRHSLNIKDGVMPAMYAYYFSASCVLTFVGRENFNVSTRITGCGYIIPTCMLENGWNYTSITEDIEFSADKTLEGNTIHYVDEAVFYDEQPTRFKTMWNQRLRWAKGQNTVSKKYFTRFFKAMFDKTKKNKVSLFVALTFNSFIPLQLFFIFVLQYLLLFLSPLFGVSLQEAFLYWNTDATWYQNLFMSWNTGALFGIAKTIASFFISSYITVFAILIGSRGRYRKQPFWPLFFGALLLPFFFLFQAPLDLTAMFVKEVKWKKIPHGVNQKK